MIKQSRILRVAVLLICVTFALHGELFAAPKTQKDEPDPSPPRPAPDAGKNNMERLRLETVEPSVPDHPFGLLSVVVAAYVYFSTSSPENAGSMPRNLEDYF
ncbi:unnamed protein product [Symbiodinium necroappetens]|uniref:Transmembrane protein n=1 Tax=Symbiodinium necroappetens TaxID=1628268 RepID=A0A812NBG9_9DINO|nr:unnamed protein product [Symbiodinium necroappetens]